jgi:hypothetical protein
LGLAMGVDKEGAGCDVRISVAELAKRITFTQRKFRGFESREIPGGLAIDLNASMGRRNDPVTTYRSERERHDEDTGHWHPSTRSWKQFVASINLPTAKIIVQADFTAAQIELVKRSLDSAIDFQRHMEGSGSDDDDR